MIGQSTRCCSWSACPVSITRYFIVLLLLGLLLPVFAQSTSAARMDVLGESHYSQYNFTDLVPKYRGVDSWVEFKLSYWLDKKEKLAVYTSTIGSNMAYLRKSNYSIPFDWQRYVQHSLGVQYYPFFKKDKDYTPLFGIRLFALGGLRWYYEDTDSTNPYGGYETKDYQIGFDYYHDNIFDEGLFLLNVWTNATFRATNFSHEKYNAFLWTGNLKAGLKTYPLNNVVLFYGLSDWTHVTACKCRWWENYLRGGIGTRIYLAPYTKDKKETKEFWRRLYIYGEYLHHIAWLGNAPERDVRNWDFRVGLGFSTSGYFRSKK